MQGLYQWQLAGADAASIERDMSQAKGFEKLDREYFSTLLAGAIRHAPQLEAALEPLLDRIAHARNSDWAVGEEAALRLVAMLADASSSPTGPTGAGEFESESVPVGVPDA